MLPALSASVTVCKVVDIRTNAMIKLPAVVDIGKAADNDPTFDPCTAFACTSAIPLPPLKMPLIDRLRG